MFLVGSSCTVECNPGLVSSGKATCTRHGFRGHPFCYQPGYGTTKTSPHIGSSLQVGLGVSSSTSTQEVEQAFGSAIIEALGIPADHLVNIEASNQASATTGSSRRLQDSSSWDLHYEFVVPESQTMNVSTLTAKAANMGTGNTPEFNKFANAMQTGSLDAAVNHVKTTKPPESFTSVVALSPSGQIVNYDTLESGDYDTAAMTHSLDQTSSSRFSGNDESGTAPQAPISEADKVTERVVHMSDTVEQGMTTNLLQMLEVDGSDVKHGFRTTRNIPGLGLATAMYLNPSGGNGMHFSMDNGIPEVNGTPGGLVGAQPKLELIEVPAETLAQLGKKAILSVLVVNASYFHNVSGIPLTVPAVNLDLHAESGLKLTKLNKPIVLTFNLGSGWAQRRAHDCVFWDEEKLRWSTEGIVTGRTAKLMCHTNHLSFFGAIAAPIPPPLVCNDVFLDIENIKQIPKGTWWYGPFAIMMVLVFVAQCSCLINATWLDSWSEKNRIWNERCFCSDQQASHIDCWDFTQHLIEQLFIDSHMDLDVFGDESVQHTMYVAVSYHLWASPVDVKYVLKFHGRQDMFYDPCMSRSQLVDKIHENVGKVFLRFYDRTNTIGQVAEVFIAVHAISHCFMKSFTISCKMQGLMLTTRLLTSMALSITLLAAWGSYYDVDDPPECKPQSSFWRTPGGAIFIGLLSAILARIPMIIVRKIHKRKVHYAGTRWWHHHETHWTEHAIRGHLFWVRVFDALLIEACFLLSVFDCFYIMAFLANVDTDTQWYLIIAFSSHAILAFVLMPFLISVLYVAMAKWRLRANPGLLNELKKRYVSEEEEAAMKYEQLDYDAKAGAHHRTSEHDAENTEHVLEGLNESIATINEITVDGEVARPRPERDVANKHLNDCLGMAMDPTGSVLMGNRSVASSSEGTAVNVQVGGGTAGDVQDAIVALPAQGQASPPPPMPVVPMVQSRNGSSAGAFEDFKSALVDFVGSDEPFQGIEVRRKDRPPQPSGSAPRQAPPQQATAQRFTPPSREAPRQEEATTRQPTTGNALHTPAEQLAWPTRAAPQQETTTEVAM